MEECVEEWVAIGGTVSLAEDFNEVMLGIAGLDDGFPGRRNGRPHNAILARCSGLGIMGGWKCAHTLCPR